MTVGFLRNLQRNYRYYASKREAERLTKKIDAQNSQVLKPLQAISRDVLDINALTGNVKYTQFDRSRTRAAVAMLFKPWQAPDIIQSASQRHDFKRIPESRRTIKLGTNELAIRKKSFFSRTMANDSVFVNNQHHWDKLDDIPCRNLPDQKDEPFHVSFLAPGSRRTVYTVRLNNRALANQIQAFGFDGALRHVDPGWREILAKHREEKFVKHHGHSRA
jgi:hypothetical protein